MRKLIFGSLFIALAAMVMVSCKKNDDEDPAPAKSKTELLTAHSWIMKDLQFEPALPPPFDTINAYNGLPKCEKDDFYTLKADGTGFKDRGSNICENEPQSDPLKWEWRNNETELYLTYSDTNWVKDVTVTSTTLKGLVEQPSPLGSGTITLRATFIKK